MSDRDKDYVDTSVYLSCIFEEGDEPFEYLKTIGYRGWHRKAVVTEYVLGELLNNMLLKLPDDEGLRRAMLFLKRHIHLKEQEEGCLTIETFASQELDFDVLQDLMEEGKFRNLTYDDALHLCQAISLEECGRFVTTDKEIFEGKLVRYVSDEYGLEVETVDTIV